MKYLLYTCLATLLIAVSCKDNAQKEQQAPETPQEDSVIEALDTLLSAETVQSFSTTGFSDYAKKKATGFNWNKFRMTSSWQEDSMLESPFTPEKGFYTNYGPFLKYAPDSSHFIDLDSYNIDIKKDAKGRFTGNEIGPDYEVSLVDVKDGIKTRLVFLGPGGSIEDAVWLDNQTLALMGVQENEKGGKTPTLWRFHLPTKTFYLYEIPDTTIAGPLMGYWRTERLKNVIIQ
jgi:hypothetical protein